MGGSRSAATRRAYYLRSIVGTERDDHGLLVEVLSCGHRQRPVSDLAGPTNAYRRYCHQCPKPAPGSTTAVDTATLEWPITINAAPICCAECDEPIIGSGDGPLRSLVDAVGAHRCPAVEGIGTSGAAE